MKQIPNYPNYSVTEDGRVWSHRRNIYLKPNLTRLGYAYINLSNENGIISKTIHRLVAYAFINNIYNKKEVNHINGIKHDNRVENLEWSTRLENITHSFDNKLRCYDVTRSNAKCVINKETGIFYDSIKEAAKTTNFSYLTILRYLNNKNKNKTSLIYA
jgi:hypothetical protein